MQSFKVSQLKNGLKVLTVPSKDVMSVKTEMIIKTGAEYETVKNQGISHVLEHMCFKGTKNRLGPSDISREIDNIGGICNAYTDNEVTGYWTKVDKKHLNKALDIISDMYLNPLFPEKELEKEKGVIIEEIHMYKDNPMDHVNDVFTGLMYGKNNPGGWSVAGTESSVKAVERTNLVRYAQNQYTAPNSLLVISGNFEEKRTIESLNAYFGRATNAKAKNKNKVKKLSQKTSRADIEYRESDQCHLILGFPSFNTFSSKKYALKILLTILDGGMSARLFKVIREELGAAYYIHAENASYLDYGFFYISTGLNPDKIEISLQAIISQLKEMVLGKITQEEIDNAKANVKGKMALGLDSVYNYTSWITTDIFLGRKYESPEQFLAKIEKITKKDIVQIAKEIFVPSLLNLAMVGPFKKENAETFLKAAAKSWKVGG